MMRQFKDLGDGTLFALDTGECIPPDPGNRQRQEVDALLLAGEAEVLPADPPPPRSSDLSVQELTAILKANGNAQTKAAITAAKAQKGI